ncbi:MAG: hypothetical protein FJ293_09840 [Planctomycetes bacterium]|nr:hypothetical protein [Planctomycetota bacterium]
MPRIVFAAAFAVVALLTGAPATARHGVAAGVAHGAAPVAVVGALGAALLAGCTGVASTPRAPAIAASIADPPATTEWHAEPILARATTANVLVLNHADPSLRLDAVAAQLQRQYDWLVEWMGFAPRAVVVHVGANYPCGFSLRAGADPEMFLLAGGIFDSADNYAHEMQHCFLSELGDSIPHWFNESLSDMAWLESEIGLWQRRHAPAWIAQLDRIDWRSYELLQLRKRFGPGYFPRVFRVLWRERAACRATFSAATKLDAKNEQIVAALTEAAGEDVLPLLRELGFDPRTRERQRGY